MSKRILGAFFLFAVTLTMAAQHPDADSGVPAYNKTPPAKGVKQPPILTKEALWGENGSPAQIHAYELAAKIPATLHQLPCFCHCDRMGHKSLRTCFEGTHGAQCDICMKELFYAYGEQKKGGKTVAQIRKGILEGQWKSVTPEQAEALN